MAVKTFYLAAGNDGSFAALVDGTAQAAASRTDGWTVGKVAATIPYSDFLVGTKQATGTFGTTAKPTALLTGASANAFKTPAPLSGTFALTSWVFTFAVRATVASSQSGAIRLRVYKSVNADGSSATDVGGVLLNPSNTAALSTTADVTSTYTWNPSVAITLSNEYLFFAIAWAINAQGGNNSADVLLRTGSAGPAGTRIVTPDFGPPQTVAVGGLNTLTGLPSYTETVLVDAPIAYYRLGESSGTTAVDSSGNGRDGSYTNAPTLAQSGATVDGDTAVRFDGVDDYVTLPSSLSIPAGSSVTIEWWQYFASADIGGNRTAFTIGGSLSPNACSCHCPYSDGNIYWDYGDNGAGGRVTSVYTGYYDKWTLVHLTFDSATNKHAISLNGVEVAFTTNANKPVTARTGGQIGAWTVLPQYQKAVMDEFAVYTTALTLARRSAHYTAGLTPPSFGKISTTVGPPPTPQSLSVPGLYPNGFIPSICGQVTCGV